MEDQLITLDIAILAKEVEFFRWIYQREDIPANECYQTTQSLLAKWLREEHNIQVYVCSQTVNGLGIYRDYVAYVNGSQVNDSRDEEYQTYEEAMEFGLYKALKKLKK